MSNRQYLPGTPIPTMNALANGTYQMICEACRCPQLSTTSGTYLYLPHTAGSYDCVEALGSRLEILSGNVVNGMVGSLQPTLDNLTYKLQAEAKAIDDRLSADMKELRTDLREFAVQPPGMTTGEVGDLWIKVLP